MSTTASPMAMASSHSPSTATKMVSVRCSTPPGSTLGRLILVESKRTPIMPCNTSNMPTLATTLARMGALRSARKMKKYANQPRSAAVANVSATAEKVVISASLPNEMSRHGPGMNSG